MTYPVCPNCKKECDVCQCPNVAALERPMTEPRPVRAPDYAALRGRIESSMARVAAMAKEGRPPRMSIPVNEERDDDVYICNTFRELRDALDYAATLEAVIDEQRRAAVRSLEAYRRLETQLERAEARVRRLAGANREQVEAYDAYRARGMLPAPNEYELWHASIEKARAVLADEALPS